MTKEQYLVFFKETTQKMLAITTAKNQDYTGGDSNPFANFTATERLGVTSTERGFLTRMLDKIMRINAYIANGNLMVKDESVEDTLLDLANYSILLAGYIKSQKGVLVIEGEPEQGCPEQDTQPDPTPGYYEVVGIGRMSGTTEIWAKSDNLTEANTILAALDKEWDHHDFKVRFKKDRRSRSA